MPLIAISGLTAPAKSQIKAINETTDKSGNTLIDLFKKNLSANGKGTSCSIGPKEKTNVTRATLGSFRIDLQKYNNNGDANFAIQTNGQGSVTVAALFMPPNTTFTGASVEAGLLASLGSAGASAFQLP